MSPDLINGCVELVGSVFTWRNAYQLYRDRKVSGVYWPATAFFTLWGFWNLYYYPVLGQWFSLAGGTMLSLGNAAWLLCLALCTKGNNGTTS